MTLRTLSTVDVDRLTGLQAFHQARREPIVVEVGHGATREARAELERRQAVREREEQAARTHAASTEWGARPRAVVVHRAPWTREALRRQLTAAGVAVLALHEDGAAGLGCVVAEQPELVLVQQQLPWRDGLEVVAEVRRYSPGTQVAVHLDQPNSAQAAGAAGAHVSFARATRTEDLVAGLLALVRN